MSNLIPRCYIGDLELTDYPFSLAMNELDLGAGENVMTFFEALLQDGSIGTSNRTGNRTLVVPIYVEGSDLLELAQNEQTLILACEKARNTFTLDPGDGIAPPSVYDTFRIQAVHARNDDMEAGLLRRWDLTIPAMPWARSADPITVTFAPATPTFTTLDDGSALTNWSVAAGSSPTTLSVQTYLGEQAIRSVQTLADNLQVKIRVSNVAPVTPYIAVDVVKGAGAGSLSAPALISTTGLSSPPVASELMPSGYRRHYFTAPSSPFHVGLVNGVTDEDYSAGVPGATIYIGGVYGATALPSTGVLAARIEGSVRTSGTLAVSGASLGHTMVYADPTMVEFGWQPDVAASWANCPEGTYAVYVKHTGALSYSAGAVVSFKVGDQTAYTRMVYASTDDEWFPVGRVTLGGRRDGRAGVFTSTVHVSAPDPAIDRSASFGVRLFRMAPDTTLTYVRDIAEDRLLIDLPSLSSPRGGVWVGDAGSEVSTLDLTDAWDYPVLTPGQTDFFVRCDGEANPVLTASYFPRAHTFNAYTP